MRLQWRTLRCALALRSMVVPASPALKGRLCSQAQVKVLVLGNGGVGKTSLIRRFCRRGPHTHYCSKERCRAGQSMELMAWGRAATSSRTHTPRRSAWTSWRRRCRWMRWGAPCACSCGTPRARRSLTRSRAPTTAVRRRAAHLHNTLPRLAAAVPPCCLCAAIQNRARQAHDRLPRTPRKRTATAQACCW